MQIILDTEIAVSRELVWRCLIDPDHYLDFMEGITQWSVDEGTTIGLGSRISMRMSVGAAKLGGLIEIVEFDPPCDIAWTSVTGVAQRGRWRLRPVDKNRTRVEIRVSYHLEGGFWAYFAGRIASPMVRAHLKHSLANLKQRVEG